MDVRHQPVTSFSSNDRASSDTDNVCANCPKRTDLETLVAELLLENQRLRFELRSAEEQLGLVSGFPVQISET